MPERTDLTPQQILNHLNWMYNVTGNLTMEQFKDGGWRSAIEKYEKLLDETGVYVINGVITNAGY